MIYPGKAAQRCALPAAGENKNRKRETAKAQKQFQKRAESQPSGAPRNDGERSFSTRETVEQKYTPNQQVNKPYKAVETRIVSQSRGEPWLPVQLI